MTAHMTPEKAADALDRATTECAQAAQEFVRVIEANGILALPNALGDLKDAVQAWRDASQALHDASCIPFAPGTLVDVFTKERKPR